MSDQFTQISRQSYGSRIVNSFFGIFIGIILFFASFIVLYWNEGRADLSQIAKLATEINADHTDSGANGKLVSVSGKITSEEKLGDSLYLIDGNYIAINRTVEMYAWEEDTDTNTTTQTGGSQTTETTYTYNKEWTSSPQNSSNFKEQTGHENPAKSIPDQIFKVNSAKVGAYDLDMDNIELSAFKKITLDNQNTNLTSGGKLENNYIYKGAGTPQAPQIGDLRINYSVIPINEQVTVFGKLQGGEITTYLDKNNNKLFRLFSGDRASAIQTMATEHKVTSWIFRLIGFVMMWLGLSMIFGPISVVLDFLPFLGSASRFVIGLITFFVSLILSILTILISMVIHNIIALIIILLIVIVLIIIFVVVFKKEKKRQTS